LPSGRCCRRLQGKEARKKEQKESKARREGGREEGREGGRGREGMAYLLVVDVVVDVAEVPDGDVGGQLGVLGPELKGKREREERKGGREGEIE